MSSSDHDWLADFGTTPVNTTTRRRASYGKHSGDAPAPPEPGYRLAPKAGAYNARAALKQMGAYFDGTARRWYVPEHRFDDAVRACKIGADLDAELTNAQVKELLHTPVNPEPTPQGCCWECGRSISSGSFRVQPHAVPDELYCGCVDRGETTRRRPNFSRTRA